jgi:hypothetical protein
MNNLSPSTPSESMSLTFDFKNLSLSQLCNVYKEIKNDSEIDDVLEDLKNCYREKKVSCQPSSIDSPTIKTPEHNRNPKRMKKTKFKSIPAPRQWWAFHKN